MARMGKFEPLQKTENRPLSSEMALADGITPLPNIENHILCYQLNDFTRQQTTIPPHFYAF